MSSKAIHSQQLLVYVNKERVLRTFTAHVDMDAIVRQLAQKAVNNKSGSARLAHGAIIVEDK